MRQRLDQIRDDLMRELDEVTQQRGQWYTSEPRQRRTIVRGHLVRAILSLDSAIQAVEQIALRERPSPPESDAAPAAAAKPVKRASKPKKATVTD